jgi:hypothetical protein
MTDTLNTLSPLGQLKQMAVSNLNGKAVPTADALLNRAHRDATDRGLVLVGLRSEVILAPTGPQSLCIVKVTVQMKSLYEAGQPIYEFEGLGDADSTTGGRVNGRLLALAETRARTRALGAALNADEEASHQSVPSAAAAVGAYNPSAGAFNPGAAMAAAASVPQSAPVTASAPGQYQGFQNGIIPFGKHKGKHLTDPSIALSDLSWMVNSLTMQDKVTPDAAKRADAQAEINRRTGGPVQSSAPAAFAPPAPSPAANAPVAFPSPAQSVAHMPAPAPSVPGTGVFPNALPTNVTITQVLPSAAAAAPDTATLVRLAQSAAMRGYDWPAFEKVIAQVFNASLNQLSPVQVQQVEQWLTSLAAA